MYESGLFWVSLSVQFVCLYVFFYLFTNWISIADGLTFVQSALQEISIA